MIATTRIGCMLAEARKGGRKLPQYPDSAPSSLEEAYHVQDAMIEEMAEPVVGWKIGLTSQNARDFLQVQEPIAGPIFQSCIKPSGARVSLLPDALGLVEVEIGLVIGAGNKIHGACPLFEIADQRLPGPPSEKVEWLVADGALNQEVIIGKEVNLKDIESLPQERVAVANETQPLTQGLGSNAMGHPVNALEWLLEHLEGRSRRLQPGNVIATGLIAKMIIADESMSLRACFSSLGQVAVHVDRHEVPLGNNLKHH